MGARRHLWALVPALTVGSACVPSTRHSTPSPTGAPEPSESFIGKDICDYFPCYTVEDVFDSPRLIMSRTTASGDTIPLRVLRIYFNEKLERKIEVDSILRKEISSYPNITEEQSPQYANILIEQFNSENIDYIFDFYACPVVPFMSEDWYHHNNNDPLMYRKTPIIIYKNETVREEGQPRVVVAPFGDGVIHVQFDRFNGNPGTYNILCPSPSPFSNEVRVALRNNQLQHRPRRWNSTRRFGRNGR